VNAALKRHFLPDTLHAVHRLLGADGAESTFWTPGLRFRPAVAGTLHPHGRRPATPVERVRPVLETFADRIFHVGRPRRTGRP